MSSSSNDPAAVVASWDSWLTVELGSRLPPGVAPAALQHLQTEVHEAAHAMAFLDMGHPLRSCRVWRDGEEGPGHGGLTECAPVNGMGHSWQQQPGGAREAAVAALAGRAAESLWAPAMAAHVRGRVVVDTDAALEAGELSPEDRALIDAALAADGNLTYERAVDEARAWARANLARIVEFARTEVTSSCDCRDAAARAADEQQDKPTTPEATATTSESATNTSTTPTTTGASPAPATTARTTGGSMSIEEVQAGLSEVESRASAAAGQLSGVRHEIDEAATLLAQLAQGSRDEEVRDALGQLQALRDELDQLGQRALRVGEQAMSYAGRM